MSEATSDDNKQTSNDPDWGRFGLGTQQPPDGQVNKSYKDADADTDSDENELFVEEQVGVPFTVNDNFYILVYC